MSCPWDQLRRLRFMLLSSARRKTNWKFCSQGTLVLTRTDRQIKWHLQVRAEMCDVVFDQILFHLNWDFVISRSFIPIFFSFRAWRRWLNLLLHSSLVWSLSSRTRQIYPLHPATMSLQLVLSILLHPGASSSSISSCRFVVNHSARFLFSRSVDSPDLSFRIIFVLSSLIHDVDSPRFPTWRLTRVCDNSL